MTEHRMTDTTVTATMTLQVRVSLPPGLDLTKVDLDDLRATLASEAVPCLEGIAFEVAYDRPNDQNAYARAVIEDAATARVELAEQGRR